MEKVLFVTNPPRRCGVHEMGAGIIKALRLSKKYQFIGVETQENTSQPNFIEIVKQHQPTAIIYNWHPATMPWLTEEITHQIHEEFSGIKQAGIVHDVPAPFADFAGIIYPDPTFREHGISYAARRLVPELRTPKSNNPEDPIVIGSFGFGLAGKGFQRIIRQTAKEFPNAKVRFHIPYSYYCDSSGSIADALGKECQRFAGNRIELEITHDYKTTDDLITWLSENTVNCFFYDEARDRGISSVIDFALAAGRPIAITHSWMFRHIRDTEPGICIENTTLQAIIDNGLKPLEQFREQYTEAGICSDYERVIDKMQAPVAIDLTPNRVLSPQDRKALIPSVKELHALEPDIMSRKFPLAVFQYAFNFEQARHTIKDHDSVMIIGGYEDPIGPSLRRLGYQVEISDPMIDGRGMDDVWGESYLTGQRWDMVISCSVLEHVEDDYLFLLQIHQIIKPGGVAYLTTDFNDNWTPGKPKPRTDVRFYTPTRLRRIAQMFPEGTFVGGTRWAPIHPYFHYENSSYGFCSITMKNVATPQESEQFHQKILQRLNERSLKQQSTFGEMNERFQLGLEQLRETQQESIRQIQNRDEKIRVLEHQLHEVHMNRHQLHTQYQELSEQNQNIRTELARYQDMLKGIGHRPLKWSLGVGRRASRFGRGIKSLFKRKPKV